MSNLAKRNNNSLLGNGGPEIGEIEKARLYGSSMLAIAQADKHGHIVVTSSSFHTRPLLRGLYAARREANPNGAPDDRVTVITERDITSPKAYDRLVARLEDFSKIPENDLIIVASSAVLRAAYTPAEELNKILGELGSDKKTITFDNSPYRNTRELPSYGLVSPSEFLDEITIGVAVDDEGNGTVIDPLAKYHVDPKVTPVESYGTSWLQLGELKKA